MKQREPEETKAFVAFSLNAAEAKIRKAVEQGRDSRKDFPEVHRVGYMARPVGLIFDPASGDTIVIGEKSKSPNLFLDDFVSALRSLYINGAYPQLTIDPEGETPEAQWHRVKMTKAIEDSHFGRVFFEGDYLLKKISLNLVKIKVPKFKTQYHLMIEKRREDAVYSRFWFKPSSVDVLISENAVFINSYPVCVLSEVLYPVRAKDEIAVKFSQSFNQRFDEFAKYLPVFEDLRNLMRWVGIAGSVSSLDFAPDLKFWLTDYQVEKFEIPQRVKGLNNIYGDLDSILSICGGVDSSFLNLRLKAKDTAALADLVNLVINSRPCAEALSWEFSLKECGFSLPPQYFSMSWFNKGDSLHNSGKYQEAMDCYDQALKIDPKHADALVNKSDALLRLGKYQEALGYAEEALKINPQDITAWYNKAEALGYLDKPAESIEAYERFIKLAPFGDRDIESANDTIRRLRKEEQEE